MLFQLDSQNLNELHSDLQSFGLNPREWSILRDRSRTYRVQSKSDRSFIFIGKTTRKGQKLKWKQLELVSL